jgi:hypothetical protein
MPLLIQGHLFFIGVGSDPPDTTQDGIVLRGILVDPEHNDNL